MNNKDFIKNQIKNLEASVASFSPRKKQEGEAWIAESFIQNLRIPYSTSEIISNDDDPPDINFRDARFEIKEILDPGRRRHDEYREELKHVRGLTNPKDIFTNFDPKDISISEIYRLCEEQAFYLKKKYPESIRNKMDLLLYVNLKEVVYVIEDPYPDTSNLKNSGWRSVSFVKGQRSCCFYAQNDAPVFIKNVLGRVSHLYP